MKPFTVKGKKVGVLGLARSGIAAANLAKANGAQVLVSEARPEEKCRAVLPQLRKGIATEFGGHSDRLLECDIIVKSPGVPNHLPLLVKAQKQGIPVWSEIELACRMVSCDRIVAITGTNGKTTTTTLVGELFKKAGKGTVVAGNIGDPLAAVTKKVRSHSTVVLEMSSYQLEDSPSFHPSISAILNVTPDHLEHHGSMKNYTLAKTKIFANQTKKDHCVLNYDDPACRRMGKTCPARVIFFSRRKKLEQGVYFADGKIHVRLPRCKATLSAALRIPGMHNIENALASVAMAAAAGLKPEMIERIITRFPGVEHRIELSGEIDGVRYYNDSKGTNVDSTRVALESFNEPLWLILGGRDKGAPYAPIAALIKEKVRGILLIGEAAPKIRRELAGCTKFYDCGTMAVALQKARAMAKPGEVVLLSPACASFDQFSDYEDRGRQFKALVKKLK